jgi:ATP-dependent Lon protease
VASLFYNKLRRSVGAICKKDFIVFDEISGTKFDNEELINMMKDYLNSGKFSRDKTELTATCSTVFIGNIDSDREKGEVKGYYHHLFIPLPAKIRNDRAFLDRIHGYIPS